MSRICDNCEKAGSYDFMLRKKIPATCDLWQAIYGNGGKTGFLELEIAHDYRLDVDLSIEIKECKGFEP